MPNNIPPKKIIGYKDSTQPIGYLKAAVTPDTLSTSDEKSTGNSTGSAPMKKQNDSPGANNENHSKEPENHDKLDELVNKQPRILYRLKTGFRFSFFPDEITIEDDKVNVVIRNFFASEEIRSSGIKDISHVEVETSLLFSTIVIGSRSFSDNSIRISGFRTEQAKRARRIIEGLRVFHAQGIDPAPLSEDEIVKKAEELGTAQGVEEPAKE